ncbi:MAG: NlpC/P60 family protein, partial [Actinomycetes bacterium]
MARAQLGSPYVWGAEGPAPFDCSGLTSFASARSIPLVPGDLVFFAADPGSPSTIHHVGMYIGKGLMAEAPHRRRRPHLLHRAPQLRRRRPPRPLSDDDGAMSPILHTARLVLTPVGDHDLAPLHAHWNDPQVARWLWDASPVPLQTVADL